MNRHTSFATLAAVAAAAAAHAAPAPAGPQITSSTVANIALSSVGNLTLDINGDSTNDFGLTWNSYNSTFTISNSAPNYSFVSTQNGVSVGTIINYTTSFVTDYTYTSPGTGILDIGFTFTATDGDHYGWLEFDFTGSDSNNMGTLKSATYQSTPYANATVTAVPEPAEGLAAAGLAGALALGMRKRRAKRA